MTQKKYGFSVGEEVITLVETEAEYGFTDTEGYHGTIVPAGTRLRIVAISPKVSLSRNAHCVDPNRYDSRTHFYNAVRVNDKNGAGPKIRENFVTIRKVKKEENVKGLREGDKRNFETLCKAFKNGDVALLDVRRKSDGAKVAAVVGVGYDPKTQEYAFTPFAIMVEGNPFELFDPPSKDGDLYVEPQKETL